MLAMFWIRTVDLNSQAPARGSFAFERIEGSPRQPGCTVVRANTPIACDTFRGSGLWASELAWTQSSSAVPHTWGIFIGAVGVSQFWLMPVGPQIASLKMFATGSMCA